MKRCWLSLLVTHWCKFHSMNMDNYEHWGTFSLSSFPSLSGFGPKKTVLTQMKALPSLTSVPSWVQKSWHAVSAAREQRWRITSGMSLELRAKRLNLAGVAPCPASRHNNLLPEGLFAHSPALCRGLEVVAERLHHQHILFLSFLSSITSSSLLTFFSCLHSCVVLPPSSRLLPLHIPPTFFWPFALT